MSDNKNPILRALDKAINALSGQGPQNSAPNTAPSDGAIARAHSIYQGAHDRKVDTGPLGAAGMAELHPRLVRPTPDQLANVPHQAPDKIAIYDKRLAASGLYAGLDRELVDIAEAKTQECLRLDAAIAEVLRNPRPAYLAHQKDLAKRVAQGGEHKDRDAWTIEDWEEENIEKLKAFKDEKKSINDDFWIRLDPQLAVKADALDLLADQVEIEERAHAREWGFDVLAPWVLGIRRYAQSLRDGSRRGAGTPLAMLEGI